MIASGCDCSCAGDVQRGGGGRRVGWAVAVADLTRAVEAPTQHDTAGRHRAGVRVPAATATAPAMFFTSIADRPFANVPSPNCPDVFWPQQLIVPEPGNAHACANPPAKIGCTRRLPDPNGFAAAPCAVITPRSDHRHGSRRTATTRAERVGPPSTPLRDGSESYPTEHDGHPEGCCPIASAGRTVRSSPPNSGGSVRERTRPAWRERTQPFGCVPPAVRPRQDSNLRTRFRKPMLYPLSYEGKVTIFAGQTSFARFSVSSAMTVRRRSGRELFAVRDASMRSATASSSSPHSAA